MKRVAIIGVLAGVAASGVIVRRTLRSSRSSAGDRPQQPWRSVTISRSQEEVMPNGQVPGPLADLGDLVEVQVRPAPGGKGTELAARLRRPEPDGLGSVAARVSGDDPRQQVRSALRQAKEMIEVGEVLRVDPAPHGHRPRTATGKLVEFATRRSGGEGVL